MAYFMIEGSDGAVIVDEGEALHLHLTREDAELVLREDLDPETDMVTEVELNEPVEGDEDIVYLVRDPGTDDFLTTEEARDEGSISYLLAFVEPGRAEEFIAGEFKEANAEQAERAEIVEATLVRVT